MQCAESLCRKPRACSHCQRQTGPPRHRWPSQPPLRRRSCSRRIMLSPSSQPTPPIDSTRWTLVHRARWTLAPRPQRSPARTRSLARVQSRAGGGTWACLTRMRQRATSVETGLSTRSVVTAVVALLLFTCHVMKQAECPHHSHRRRLFLCSTALRHRFS